MISIFGSDSDLKRHGARRLKLTSADDGILKVKENPLIASIEAIRGSAVSTGQGILAAEDQ